MIKFDRVLSDAELISATFKADVEGTMGELRAVEQAVLAKLAEQDPMAWVILDSDGVPQDVEPFYHGDTLSMASKFKRPLYTHPMPTIDQEPVAWRVWLKDLQLWSYSSECHGCGEPLYAAPQPTNSAQIPRKLIRALALKNGFTLKGEDLHEYVYNFANELAGVVVDSALFDKSTKNHLVDKHDMVPEYAEVYVGDGLFSICDWKDWNSIKGYKWSLSTRNRSGCLYAQTKVDNGDGTRSRLAMHHAILPQKDGFVIDHINGNGLDNRRCNLRYATVQQNSFNQKTRKASSIYKGVSFDKESGSWRATIGVNGKKIYGGRHETELEAAKAYDEMAKKHFGEFAVLNLA